MSRASGPKGYGDRLLAIYELPGCLGFPSSRLFFSLARHPASARSRACSFDEWSKPCSATQGLGVRPWDITNRLALKIENTVKSAQACIRFGDV